MSLKSRVVSEAQGLSQALLTFLHLMVCFTEQNAITDFCLTNDDSWQFANSTQTKQFLQPVYILTGFTFEIVAYSFFSVKHNFRNLKNILAVFMIY